MKKRIKRGWIVALCAGAISFALAGCSSQPTKDELLSKNDLTTEVVYYANGGYFDEDNDKVEKSIYYQDNSYAYKIEETGLRKVEYANYELTGWYYAKLDDDGVPIKDENGNFEIGDAVPFDKPIAEWSSTKIVAAWSRLSKVKVKLVIGDEGDSIGENDVVEIETIFGSTKEWKTCKTGDEIRDYSFANGQVQAVSKLTLSVKDDAYTFLAFYADEACTTSVAWPLEKPTDNAKDDIYIYAKYIKGNWTMLSTADDVKTMYTSANSNKATTRYFLKNDIDCAALATINGTRVKFNCELKGNGYTISNLTISQLVNKKEDKRAFFGTLGANAKITNVVFENVNMEIKAAKEVSVYLAFTDIEEGATIDNVQFKNAKITLDFADKDYLSNNIETNWKFGGYETDEAYTGGCTVDTDSQIGFKEKK